MATARSAHLAPAKLAHLTDEKGLAAIPALCKALEDKSAAVKTAAAKLIVDLLGRTFPLILSDQDGPLIDKRDLVEILQGRGAAIKWGELEIESLFIQLMGAMRSNPAQFKFLHPIVVKFLAAPAVFSHTDTGIFDDLSEAENEIINQAYLTAKPAVREDMLANICELAERVDKYSVDSIFSELIKLEKASSALTRQAVAVLTRNVSARNRRQAGEVLFQMASQDADDGVRAAARSSLIDITPERSLGLIKQLDRISSPEERHELYALVAALIDDGRKVSDDVKIAMIERVLDENDPELLRFLFSQEIGLENRHIIVCLRERADRIISRLNSALSQRNCLSDTALAGNVLLNLLHQPPENMIKIPATEALAEADCQFRTALAKVLISKGRRRIGIHYTPAEAGISHLNALAASRNGSLWYLPFNAKNLPFSIFNPLAAGVRWMEAQRGFVVIIDRDLPLVAATERKHMRIPGNRDLLQEICGFTPHSAVYKRKHWLIDHPVKLIPHYLQAGESDRIFLREIEAAYLIIRTLAEIEAGTPVEERLRFYNAHFQNRARLNFASFLNALTILQAVEASHPKSG